MGGLLEMSAECEMEFINNWDTFTDPDTIPIQFADRQFNSDGLEQYIALNFMGLEDDVIGMNGTSTGRIEYAGVLYISVFHKTKKYALKLADTAIEFLRGKELPLNVRVLPNAKVSPTYDLDNDFYEVIVSFQIRQC